jgi:hypothetical protein
MSLPILVAIVVVGISLTVAAVHFTGGGKLAVMSDGQEALRIFARDHPEETATIVHLTADRRAAFLALPGSRTGIVRGIGDRYLTRVVTPCDVKAVARNGPGIVSIHLRDFTWRGGDFEFDDPIAADAVLRMFGGEGQKPRTEA